MSVIISAPNFNDEQNPTITYSLDGTVNPNNGYIKYAEAGIFPTTVGAFPESERLAFVPFKPISVTGSSYTFNLTAAERNALMNAFHGSLKVRFYIRYEIDFYADDYDHIFYEHETRDFTIINAEPIVEGTVVDTNELTIALTGNPNTLIKYHNTATATLTRAEGKKGAVIDADMYIIKNNTATRFGRESTFYNVESNVFRFSAQDSRGIVGSFDFTTDMVDYIKPTCKISNSRPDAVGNMKLSCSGAFFNDSFGAVENTLSVQYRYTVTGTAFSDNWVDMDVTKLTSSYYADADFSIDDFNQQQYYSFEIRVIDKLETVTSSASGLKSTPLFHWGEDDFVFEVPVVFKAGVSGELGFFYGRWYPEIEGATSYSSNAGWYSVVGNIVTIGFHIKAYCDTSAGNTNIIIHNSLFRPMFPAAGGGMCSGAYISGGFNFQCFVAETDGTITTRVQACNNTSSANLSTSASGCKCRSDGGEVTLSGTISFIDRP